MFGNKIPEHIVVCYSGGLDSFAMGVIADGISKRNGIKITKVYFDIGHAYAKKEMLTLPQDVEIRKVDWIGSGYEPEGKEGSSSGNIIIPGRNAVFAVLAASIYSPDAIMMGGLKGEDHEGSTDKNQKFIDKVNDLLGYVHSPFKKVPQVIFPFLGLEWGKYELVDHMLNEFNVTREALMKTSSCLNGNTDIPCGTCVVCARRAGIFRQFGFSEEYVTEPFESPELFEMYIEMLSYETSRILTCHYDVYRRREIVPALGEFYHMTKDQLLDYYVEKLQNCNTGDE